MRPRASTAIAPRSVSSTPAASRPKPSTRGAKPNAASNLSASSTCASPPSAGLTVTFTPLPVSSTWSTLVESSTFTPSFLYCLSSSLETSLSSVGTIRSRNSTIVTSTPKFVIT